MKEADDDEDDDGWLDRAQVQSVRSGPPSLTTTTGD